MRSLTLAALTLVLALPAFAAAGGRTGGSDTPAVPSFVRTAHTAAVIVDPDAGASVDDPRANQVAQRDVEAALQDWGRYQVVLNTSEADIIVVVRKGLKHTVQQTLPDPRQNRRPGSITTTDQSIGIGAHRGPQPPLASGPPTPPTEGGPGASKSEISSSSADTFTVFEGRVDKPLDAPPAWRLTAKDILKSPKVPAVDAFRKAVAEADKLAAKKP